MKSVLVRFKNKSYYIDYGDLLNKANDKLFAYEDQALQINAKLNGKTLMFNKKDMEDKLKGDIKMPTRMPSNLATESKMTNEQKLRKYIRERIVKMLKEGDPYGRPDEDKYLFKTGQDYLAGIQGESLDEKVDERDLHTGAWYECKILTKAQDGRRIKPGMWFMLQNVDKREGWVQLETDKYNDEQKNEFFVNYPDFIKNFKIFYLHSEVDDESVNEEGEAPSEEDLAAQQKAAQEKARKQAYQRFFSQALAKFGVSSVNSLPDDKKKAFWDYIDTNWTSKQETQGKVKTEGHWGNMPRHDSYFIDKKHGFDTIHKILNKLHGKPDIIDVSWSEGLISAEEGADLSKYLTPEEFKLVNTTDDWTDPAGGVHSWDDDDPAKMYEEPTIKLEKGGTYTANKAIVDLYGNEVTAGEEYVVEEFKPYGLVHIHNLSDDRDKYVFDYDVFIAKNFTSSQITETSATGGVDGYMTPRAFTGKKDISKKQKQIANQLGYELVDKSYAVKDQGNPGDLNESMDSFYLKDESLRPEQKLGLAMRHVRNNLYEVEKVIQRTIKMKNEEGIDSTKVGKRTYQALKRINEKVIRLMVALQDLK